MSKPAKVEILDFKDCKKAARTLYKAFDDDNVARYVSRHLEGNPELKKRCDLLLYEAYVYSHMLKGLVVAVKGENSENSDTFETVALWTSPETGYLEDYLTMLRSGYASLAWLTGAEGRRRIFHDLFETLKENSDDIMSSDPDGENMWVLVYLGTTPEARGHGNVRALFEYMFNEHIDLTNSLAYLESSALQNIPIYEKFGFRCVSDEWLGDKNDPVDTARMDVMIRGPKGTTWKYLDEVRSRRGYEIPEASKLR
ncbi:DEKNAAC103440 [Brettanomyces naardenensis]|uniref:DEKNAAC103440 n=1 Tax=Brettanomyces naardenensis TaxID=13370 RepID=A0A448YN83_BRENA|nr:DEKNAAC103440 [Brettanomyces naardenensis]